MNKLGQFILFNWEAFSKGKRFMSIGRKDWKDFNTGTVKGTCIEAVIVQDSTKYDLAEGEMVSNIYEKLVFKVPHVIDIPMNVEIQPKQVIATVYGDYRDKLSVTAEEIIVVQK